MTREKRSVPFASEAAMCASFSGAATAQGWTVYPETSGWDLLLVNEETQIGVEAKLRPNLKLLGQIAERMERPTGPDFVAGLVPSRERDRDFWHIAGALGIIVFCQEVGKYDWQTGRTLPPDWPLISNRILHARVHAFPEPSWTPPLVPTLPAGVPCPVKLTPWKIKALELLARLEVRGFVTAADMRECGLAPTIWYSRYLESTHGARGCWKRRSDVVLADAQHPVEFAHYVAEERRRLEALGPVAPSPAAPVSRLPLFPEPVS